MKGINPNWNFKEKSNFIGSKKLRRLRKKNRKSQNQKDDFLSSYEWRQLRIKVLIKFGRRCMCCGATPEDGIKLHVDHIKPRKRYPELALDESNLQVLCEACNHGKGNWLEKDFRTRT